MLAAPDRTQDGGGPRVTRTRLAEACHAWTNDTGGAMPGFDWSSVPTRLAAELARELALEEAAGGPAAALRATFGPVPRVDFVRIAWPILRDRWLTTDSDARADVVAGLRAAGLGDHEAAPRGSEAQLGYLRSCRN